MKKPEEKECVPLSIYIYNEIGREKAVENIEWLSFGKYSFVCLCQYVFAQYFECTSSTSWHKITQVILTCH